MNSLGSNHRQKCFRCYCVKDKVGDVKERLKRWVWGQDLRNNKSEQIRENCN